MTTGNLKKDKNSRNKYIGSYRETGMKKIDLPCDKKSLMTLLSYAQNPTKSPYTHQDISHWCDQNFIIGKDSGMDEKFTDILSDISAQWDLNQANSYSLKELQGDVDFSKIQLPLEWFENWLNKLNEIQE
jgi:hypothetical protein